MANLTRYTFDDLLDEAFEPLFGAFSPFVITAPRRHRHGRMLAPFSMQLDGNGTGLMRCDIHEDDSSYSIKADLPGIDKKSIDVTYDDDTDMLVIACKQDEDKQEKTDDGTIVRSERFSSYASRSFMLPRADKDNIKARYEDGVLHVTVTKLPPDQAEDTAEDNAQHIEIE